MKKYKGIVAAILGLSVIAVSGCGSDGGDDMDMDMMMAMMMQEEAISVETAYPTVRTISQSGSYIGTIETGDKVSVTPRVGGYVKTKYFGLGDVVNAGDVLFTIDDTNLQLEKKKAEADVQESNATLAKNKAANESTKFEVNETLNTLDTKSQENYNNIQKALRTEYEAQLDLYKACVEEGLYKDEGEYLEDLIKKDKDSIENAKDFTKMLKGHKSAYNSILNAGSLAQAITMAEDKYGVAAGDLATAATEEDVANVYLEKKAMYESIAKLDTAIASSEEAQETARATWRQHESSNRTNDISIVSSEVAAEKQKGNIASAQEDTALKRKIAADYEIFTKAKIWAAQQAKLAEGDASVLSANVGVSKAKIDLEIAERKLQDTNVKSPVNGEIIECKVEDFGTVSDSSVAYTIIDTSSKKAVFYVTGEAKNNMAVGQSVTIDKNGTQYNATVDQISDTPDEKKLLYRIAAVIGENDKADLDAGTNVRLITSIKTSENVLTVPISIVYYDEGRAFVYVAKNGVAAKTFIETGVADATDIEVTSGLTAEDQVIVNWSEQLQDNAAINVTKTAEKSAMPTVTVDDASKDPTDMTNDNASSEDANAGSDAAVSETPQKVYIETTSNVNIRRDPTTDSEKLETVKKGTRLEKAGDEAGGWTRIIYNGTEAYVSSDYVRECK